MAAILALGNDASPSDSGGAPWTSPVSRSVLHRWGAVLSHRSAAAHWRLLPPTHGPVDVSVPGIGGKARRKGVHVHRSRTLTPKLATSHRGIPVTTPSRTIADLRRAASTRGCPAKILPWELRRAIRQAEVLGLATGAEELTERSRSDLELVFLRLCRRHRLREPEINVWVGSLQVDFLWRQERLIVETDGYRYHRGRAAFENDHTRDLELRALGYEVKRFSDRQVAEEPDKLVAALKEALAASGSLRRGVAEWVPG